MKSVRVKISSKALKNFHSECSWPNTMNYIVEKVIALDPLNNSNLLISFGLPKTLFEVNYIWSGQDISSTLGLDEKIDHIIQEARDKFNFESSYIETDEFQSSHAASENARKALERWIRTKL